MSHLDPHSDNESVHRAAGRRASQSGRVRSFSEQAPRSWAVCRTTEDSCRGLQLEAAEPRRRLTSPGIRGTSERPTLARLPPDRRLELQSAPGAQQSVSGLMTKDTAAEDARALAGVKSSSGIESRGARADAKLALETNDDRRQRAGRSRLMSELASRRGHRRRAVRVTSQPAHAAALGGIVTAPEPAKRARARGSAQARARQAARRPRIATSERQHSPRPAAGQRRPSTGRDGSCGCAASAEAPPDRRSRFCLARRHRQTRMVTNEHAPPTNNLTIGLWTSLTT